MLNLPFQIFYLALRYLTEEENSSQCLKILTQITIEDKNELAEIRGFRPKKITSKSFDNDNKLTLKSFFAFCSVFVCKDQRRKDGDDLCPVSKILQS